jgi:AAA domain
MIEGSIIDRAQAAAAALRVTPNGHDREPIGKLARDIEPERVDFLWPGRLAAGKITVLDGDPGLGKSTLALEIAARVSCGDALPGGPSLAPRGVVVLSAEDGAADTIAPRLRAANADLGLVFVMSGIRAVDGVEDPVTLPGDLPAIECAIVEHNAALLIIDPLVAFLGGETNASRDQDVRRALAPLAAMLERTGCAAILIRHLNKMQSSSALYRGGGSIGIIGAARFGLLVARDPDDDEARVIAPVKCNIGPHPPALRFRLESVSGTDVARVVWDDAPVSIDAAGLLAVATGDQEERSALEEASDWLRELLELGPKPAAEVLRDARRDGIAEKTLRRARSRLGVKSSREGFGPGSRVMWFLPDRPPYDDPPIDGQSAIRAQAQPVGHLWEVSRNGAENRPSIDGQLSIHDQPHKSGNLCGAWPPMDDEEPGPDPVVVEAKRLTTLSPDDLNRYRADHAGSPALALFDVAKATGLAPCHRREGS